MYRHTAWIALGAFALVGAAAAQTLEIVEGARELELGNVSFPDSTAGTLIFKNCPTCEATALRVSSTTTYSTAQGQQDLPAFLERVAEIDRASADSDKTPLTVFYSLATGRVTRISVHDDSN